eukprot:55484-Chlamydomonas_euryale.AAC.1
MVDDKMRGWPADCVCRPSSSESAGWLVRPLAGHGQHRSGLACVGLRVDSIQGVCGACTTGVCGACTT